jgi:hypothetical protein
MQAEDFSNDVLSMAFTEDDLFGSEGAGEGVDAKKSAYKFKKALETALRLEFKGAMVLVFFGNTMKTRYESRANDSDKYREKADEISEKIWSDRQSWEVKGTP